MDKAQNAIVGGQNVTSIPIKVKMKLTEGGREGGNRLLAPKAFFQNGESRGNVKLTKQAVKIQM